MVPDPFHRTALASVPVHAPSCAEQLNLLAAPPPLPPDGSASLRRPSSHRLSFSRLGGVVGPVWLRETGWTGPVLTGSCAHFVLFRGARPDP